MHSRITQRLAKRSKPAAPPRTPRRLYIPVILILILLCGLWLRLAGLSHGLSEGEIYHPDTPHILLATRCFLEGTYFFRINHPDYDGYPYFYSHVVEWLWRGIRGISSFFSRLLLGAEHTAGPMRVLDLKLTLFWLARITNVVFSTLAILIVYRIAARNLDRTTGLLAAGLLAVSPMDVAMPHFATNDTMVCFFVTLTVLFAVRILAVGLWYDYLVAGMLVACSFSAKYHGAIVGLTCLVAHVLRYWPPRRVFSGEALSRLGLLVATCFVTVLLANPGFLVSPDKAFHDFRKFIEYIPGARLTKEQMAMGLFARAWLSCKLNFPILLRSLGWVVTVVGFAGLIRAFLRGKRVAVLASFPAFYLLFTFLSKPVQQRFYLAAFFPIFLLLGAALLVELTRIKKVRAVAIIVVGLILSPAVFYLSKSSLTEVFFFSHSDTRKCAKDWARQSIPRFYRIVSGRYTFALDRQGEEPESRGTIVVSSSIRPVEARENMFLLKVFDLEENALPLFRNPKIEIRAEPSSLLSEGFVLPTYQRLASRNRNDLVFTDGACFYHDERMTEFGPERPVSRVLVSRESVDSAIVVVKNGLTPGSVRVRMGGISSTFFIEPGGVRWKELKGMRQSFASSSSRHFYRLSASGTVPGILLVVALSGEEKGVALYSIGEYAAAYPFLVEAARKTNSPLLSAMAYVSGKLSVSGMPSDEGAFLLQKASVLQGDLTPETVRSAFGISLDYLDALPYFSFKPGKNSPGGFHLVGDVTASADSAVTLDPTPPNGGVWRFQTPPLILEPGCYVATVRARCEAAADPNARIAISLLERGAKVVRKEQEFPASALKNEYAELRFPFEKPVEVGECRIQIACGEYIPLFVDRIEIRPEPLRSLQGMQRLLKITLAGPDSLPEAGPLDYPALICLGRLRLDGGQHHEALPYYLLAHQLRPDLAEPIRRMESMSTGLTPEETKAVQEILSQAEKQKETVEVHEVNVAFKNEVKLTGYAISRGPFRPGDELGLSLYWSVPRTRNLPGDMIVWVHFLGEGGKKILQLDRYLLEDIRLPQKPDRFVPILDKEVRVPDDTPPGKYRIEIGLWIPFRDWRPEVASASVPHSRYSATIAEIVVEGR